MKLVAFIFSFNRPQYLSQVLDSLKSQTDQDVHYVLVQDGAVNKFSKATYAKFVHIHRCIELYEQASLPAVSCRDRIASLYNFGMAYQKLYAYTYAFKTYNYDACLCFEDDLVVSPHYVRLMRLMLEQFKDDQHIATVQACDHPAVKTQVLAAKPEDLKKVKFDWRHFWGYATWKYRWLKHEPFYMKYFSLVRNRDYRLRPHAQIRKLTGIKQSSHDAALDWCIKQCGQEKLVTVIPRGTYIGANGVHCRPDHFRKTGYGERLSYPIKFPYDALLENFECPGK